MKVTTPDLEREAVSQAAFAIAAAARTAPKGRGVDILEILVLTDEEKDALADKMDSIGIEKNTAFFRRDSANVRKAQAIVLIGAKDATRDVPNCGFCGFPSCVENRAAGAACAIAQVDLGVACGSAVALAADLRVDSRLMFSAGKSAIASGLFGSQVTTAYGIPLSVSGKSIFFDRA